MVKKIKSINTIIITSKILNSLDITQKIDNRNKIISIIKNNDKIILLSSNLKKSFINFPFYKSLKIGTDLIKSDFCFTSKTT